MSSGLTSRSSPCRFRTVTSSACTPMIFWTPTHAGVYWRGTLRERDDQPLQRGLARTRHGRGLRNIYPTPSSLAGSVPGSDARIGVDGADMGLLRAPRHHAWADEALWSS